MRELLRTTTVYNAFRRAEDAAHFTLAVFPDKHNQREL